MKRYRIFEWLGVVAGALLIVAGSAANAQSNSGSVTGTVADSTGASTVTVVAALATASVTGIDCATMELTSTRFVKL